MGTPSKTPEQLAQELAQEEANTQQQIDDAAAAAGQEAESKGLSPAEVRAAIEKARKEEKDKLYPQLEALKDSIKDIQETLRLEREEKEQIKKQAEEAAEKRRLDKLSEGDKMLEAVSRLEEKLEQERLAREKSERENEQYRVQQALEAHKALVIAEAGSEIIPELVGGSTIEEIDNSVNIAKARYAELVDSVKNAQGAAVRRGLSGPANPDNAALEEQDLNEQLTAVDQDKYLADPEYRDKIQRELAGAYAKAAGRA